MNMFSKKLSVEFEEPTLSERLRLSENKVSAAHARIEAARKRYANQRELDALGNELNEALRHWNGLLQSWRLEQANATN